MKKLGIIIFLAALIAGLVVSNLFSFGRAAGSLFNFSVSNSVKGSGNISTERRGLSEFSSLEVGGIYQVEVITGDEYSVEIQADDNILPLIRTEVNGDRLSIDSEQKFKPTDTVKVTVTTPGIEQVEASGASSVTLASVKNSELTVNASGASKVKVNGESEKFSAELSGASKLDGESLKVKDAEVSASGASSATVFVSRTLRADASGASKVYYAGSPANVEKTASGASRVEQK